MNINLMKFLHTNNVESIEEFVFNKLVPIVNMYRYTQATQSTLQQLKQDIECLKMTSWFIELRDLDYYIDFCVHDDFSIDVYSNHKNIIQISLK